jgi:hypothetical protein
MIENIPETNESLTKKKVWLINKYNNAINGFSLGLFSLRLEDKREEETYISDSDIEDIMNDAIAMNKPLSLSEGAIDGN